MAEVVRMPKLGFDMAEGVLVRWMKAEGEAVHEGQILAEIETDKATVEVEAQAGGVVRKLLVEESSTVPVGTPIAIIGEAGEEIDLEALLGPAMVEELPPPQSPERPIAPQRAPAIVPSPAAVPGAPGPEERVKASPLARRLAGEHGIHLARVHGSGKGGRIVKKDIQALILAAARPAAAAPPIPPAMVARETFREPLSGLRSVIGRRMTGSKQQVPHFYLSADLDAAPLMRLRSDMNAILPQEEKLSVNDFIVKACALALREFPQLNAAFDGEAILRLAEVNIGVAVAVERGLMTVVVRHADRTGLRAISRQTREMVARARAGRVRLSDIEGSTFTVSNLGMFHINHFSAIINPPEAGILAVGGLREVPIVQGESILIGQRMMVTLSADHRVTDGAEAARWLQTFRQYFEQPMRLINF